MNKTHFQHTWIAIVLQLATGPFMGWWQAAAFATGIFFAREYAQVEYKLRQKTGMSLTDMMPWHVLKPSLWSKDAMLDWITPLLGCSILASLMSMYGVGG